MNLPPIFCTRLFNSGLAREQQRVPAFAAQVAAAFVDQPVALGGEREVAVRAGAAIDVTGHAAAFDVLRMATIGGQFVHPAHDQLPLFTMGRDAVAKQLMGDQVRDFVGHGLFEEVVAVFAVQLWIEAQQVFMQVRHTGLLAAQLEADHGALERALEKRFGKVETVFDAGIEQLGHAVRFSRARDYAASLKRAKGQSAERFTRLLIL